MARTDAAARALREGVAARAQRLLATPRGLRLLRALASRSGSELVARDYYSPLPELDRLPERLWQGPAELAGVDLRIESALTLLTELSPWIAEFRPPSEAAGAGFFLRNGAYESVDAEVLYAIVRHFKPARVVELGSGASSHVIWAAGSANRAQGHAFSHRIFDPHPFEASSVGPVTGPAVERLPVELLDASEVEALADNDVLFVDTTHTVKTGGDVTRVFLDLLPRLARGVLVHVHDIFLPYEYPREWVIGARRAWAEQYLLQAFLAFNDSFEVVFPANAVARADPDALARAVPSFGPAVLPGAFWIRRRV